MNAPTPIRRQIADTTDPVLHDRDRVVADHLEELRQARAGLAWLFKPDAPALLDLLARFSVPEAFARLAAPSAVAVSHLRREVRHIPTRDLFTAATKTVAGATRHQAHIVIPEDADWPAGVADAARTDRDAT